MRDEWPAKTRGGIAPGVSDRGWPDETLKEVIDCLVGIFLDQFDHSLEIFISDDHETGRVEETNCGHDGLAIIAFNIAKRHLGALIVVELELRKIQIWYLGQRYYEFLSV